MDNKQTWRVTALCRPKVSIGHNERNPSYVQNQDHIDPARPHKIIYSMGTEQETYDEIFSDAIEKYNKGQRKDRRINN